MKWKWMNKVELVSENWECGSRQREFYCQASKMMMRVFRRIRQLLVRLYSTVGLHDPLFS